MNAGSRCHNFLIGKFITMKFYKIISITSVLLLIGMFYSGCEKTIPITGTPTTNFNSTSFVQIFNGTVKATRNYAYVDATPVSGVTFSAGGVFPATAFAFNVQSGSRNFLIKDTLVTTTQAPLNFTENVEGSKSYTIFMYDTITSPKEVMIANTIEVPTDSTSRLRFANIIYNSAAVPNVDVYSFRRGTSTPVFTNIATNAVTPFIPYASGSTDTLYVYATGTTSPLIVKTLIPSLTPQRSYTAAYNGSYRGTKTISTFVTY